jgi:hypothetical protein
MSRYQVQGDEQMLVGESIEPAEYAQHARYARYANCLRLGAQTHDGAGRSEKVGREGARSPAGFRARASACLR